MRVASMVVVVCVAASCSKPSERSDKESDTVEAYRFMTGGLAFNFCLTSLHLLSLDRRNVERGAFDPNDRVVVEQNLAALRRMKRDFDNSLVTLYADETRRTRDKAALPFFELTIECHEAFLTYADAPSKETREHYVDCQQRIAALAARMQNQ
ncbi:MAG: hypothetical protein QM817_40015 [Archangium sp.]